MSAYQMKKSLRKAPGAPKSYAQLDQQAERIHNQERKERDLKEIVKESIFQHKNWTVKEKIKLMVFFNYYIALPDWNSERRSIHLFKHLSNFMKKTRTPQQCKNIHSLLKRKFMSLEDVIEAMRLQLQQEETYQKLLLKYQKEIEGYQMQNRLKDERFDQQKYESLRSRRVTQKDDRKQCTVSDVLVRQGMRQYKTQKDGGESQPKLNLSQYIKRQQPTRPAFQIQRQKLAKQATFYFKQWLKYTLILKQRQSPYKPQ